MVSTTARRKIFDLSNKKNDSYFADFLLERCFYPTPKIKVPIDPFRVHGALVVYRAPHDNGSRPFEEQSPSRKRANFIDVPTGQALGTEPGSIRFLAYAHFSAR